MRIGKRCSHTGSPRELGERPRQTEKWGRYCYRPHSHRRWASEETLIAWRVTFGSSTPEDRLASGYVARRSRRCRIRYPDWRNRKRSQLCHFACPRPVLSSGASSGSVRTEVLPSPPAPDFSSGLSNDCALRSQQSGWLSASEEASFQLFLFRDVAITASNTSVLSCIRIGRRSFVAETFRLR